MSKILLFFATKKTTFYWEFLGVKDDETYLFINDLKFSTKVIKNKSYREPEFGEPYLWLFVKI